MGRARLQGVYPLNELGQSQRKWRPPAVRNANDPSEARSLDTKRSICGAQYNGIRQQTGPFPRNLPDVETTRCIRLFSLRLVGAPREAHAFVPLALLRP